MNSISDMLTHSLLLGLIAFTYMGLFGHSLPSLPFHGSFFEKENESNMNMMIHSLVIAFVAFIYMGVFGHKLPTKLSGPFFKTRINQFS